MEEHALTHMPYRSWCLICAKAKGKQDAYKQQHSKQPVIQIDFGYLKTSTDEQSVAVLAAVDLQSQLCMALAVPDKAIQHDCMINSLRSFILGCGRTNGIIQCDNHPTLKTVATGAAAKIGNMIVRQTPTYSSNSQGSVEKFHRTVFGQGKSLREVVKANYKQPHDWQQSSIDAVDDMTFSVAYQQILDTLWWPYKLPRTMGKRLQTCNLWVWRNSTLHSTSKATCERRLSTTQSYLARSGRQQWWIMCWYYRRSHQSTNK